MAKEDLISVKFDSHAAITWLDDIQKKQLPYATSRAVNDTSALAVEAVKYAAKSKFINRRDWFNKNMTYEASHKSQFPKIKSKVGYLERKGADNDWIVNQELGLAKKPKAGTRTMSRPVDIRKSKSDILSPKLWARNMKDIEWRKTSMITKADGSQIVRQANRRRRKKGANTRFTIRTKKGKLAIVVRESKARKPLRFLYVMEHEIKLKTKVSINDIVTQVANKELPIQFILWLDRSIKNARRKK